LGKNAIMVLMKQSRRQFPIQFSNRFSLAPWICFYGIGDKYSFNDHGYTKQ
jgi:hypothetical protein